MLDPDNCILCRACEDVCPWNCIWMMSAGHRPGRRRGVGRGRGAATSTPCSWWTTTPAPAARCAWTGAPPTPCTMRDCPRARAEGARWPRFRRRKRGGLRHGRGPRREGETWRRSSCRRRAGRRPAARDRGLELDLPAGLDLPEGLQGHPAQPLLRDHEQRAVPPAPGEGEAPRGEGELHALPRRPVVLPLHPAHGHRHLPDVLLPAAPRRQAWHTTCRHPADLGVRSASWCATCTGGGRT